jgi:ATPase subunit of ABC transporter with duplicated ATPase domains
VDIATVAPEIRRELEKNLKLGVAHLTELAGRYSNDRELVYKAVLLKRALGRQQAQPTQAQIDDGVKLLELIVQDQAAAESSGAETRFIIAEAARSRALTMPVPKEVVFECSGLEKQYRRGTFALRGISLEARYGEIVGIVGRNGNGKTTLFRLRWKRWWRRRWPEAQMGSTQTAPVRPWKKPSRRPRPRRAKFQPHGTGHGRGCG